ncbi:lytic murein transglycosylase B [Pseudomarimonas salicorniae]|uniref:Lytic murein transglycosylase B n=1 Tax=Pseudomarimonas salicorniae TaxID=2933270 RepID=A0ABT0GHA8_9GAMM|nr:lytic murein transglycosylase B [Lysobacter sp. CAU 1642]MCK7593936.1 lytic murein transglycosylase B [Lysobacter sp. CAU 1642]
MRLTAFGILFSLAGVALAAPTPVDREALARELAAAHKLDPAVVLPVLREAEYKQAIIDAITRPAEAKPWKAYRQIFLTEKRISEGRAFLAEHANALAKVELDTGVPASIIVAIIGVETHYGKITGSWRVIDALFTLGAHYPPRQPFFRSELGHLFALAREEQLDPLTLKGSYAGAMGWGQFMPSSYRAYARDGDGDGRRDLFGSLPDIFASVANYFVAHGWTPGQPVVVPARRAEGAADFKPDGLKAEIALEDLAARGYTPVEPPAEPLPATLLSLEGEAGTEHWIGFNNFYVITRYNRSPLYAMAVYQLAGEIAAGKAGSGTAP